jgi:hypothetical protein
VGGNVRPGSCGERAGFALFVLQHRAPSLFSRSDRVGEGGGFFRVILFVCTRLRVVCTQGACGLLPGPITMHFNTSPSPVKVLGVGVCLVGLLGCTRDEV